MYEPVMMVLRYSLSWLIGLGRFSSKGAAGMTRFQLLNDEQRVEIGCGSSIWPPDLIEIESDSTEKTLYFCLFKVTFYFLPC